MEVKAEAEEENSVTVKMEQNVNSNGTETSRIETELTISDTVKASVEPVKEEMETSLDTDVKDQETQPETEDTEDTTEHGQIKNATPVESDQDVAKTVKSTDATEDDSESTKQVNPLKRKRSRPIKRKRKAKMHRVVATNKPPQAEPPKSDPCVDTSTEVKEDVEYCLTVSNLPKGWSFMEIKNYIDTECGPVDEIEMIKDDKTGIGAIRLSYETEEACKSAMQKLEDKEVAGNKLVLEIAVVSLESDSEAKSDAAEAKPKPWKPDLDFWEVDPQGMYGLKLQYLRSLGITPPLDKWVHVSNFRCDKSELRDVMEMAGNVQMCSVFTVTNKYANIMYNHPLEAVQAVAMLNNQMFYGQQLKVAMDRSPVDTILLPKGLTNIGKGLGLNGKPLKNIVKHYERFVENKDCLINPAVFDVPENHSMRMNDGFESVKFQVKSVEEFNYPLAPDMSKAVPGKDTKATTLVQKAPKPKPVQTPPANKQTPAFTMSQPMSTPVSPVQNFQQRPLQQNFRPFSGPQDVMNGHCMPGPQGPGPMGPMGSMGPVGPMGSMGPVGPMGSMGPVGPMAPVGPMGPPMQSGPRPQPHPGFAGPPGPQGPFVRPFAGPMNPVQGPMRPGWGQGPMRPPMNPNEPVKLILSNLPPSTTFPLLCDKMSEWGHVVCIQLTTPGCAVVTYGNRMQADACYQFYNGRNIENHLIQVKYA